MLAFVDESGDPGFKFERGSSAYFAVSLVVFNEPEDANDLDKRIDLLRKELGLPANYEFKFNKCSREIKLQFLSACKPYNFFFFGLLIDKKALTGKGFQFKEPFYKYLTQLVFQNAKEHLEEATIIIDGSGSRDFRKSLEGYFKKKINSGTGLQAIKKIKIQDSHRNNLLQVADMVVGAMARTQSEGRRDQNEYWEIIAHRCLHLQRWPETLRPLS